MAERSADLVIVSAQFLTDHGRLTKQDPYIAFEYNGTMFKTTVKKRAGLNASWNERFRLKPLRQPNELFLQAFASNLITDDFIGETGMVKLNELGLGQVESEMALWDKDKQKRGVVKINIHMRDHETASGAESESESEVLTETEESDQNGINNKTAG